MSLSRVNGLVSIIMPAFNAEKFIVESIKSVIEQSYEQWELLVVDDCSNDSTAEIVTGYSEVDKRVKLIRAPINGGPAKARNIALEVSKGQYIAFLDSDDLWTSIKLASAIDALKNLPADMIYTSYKRISADGKTTGRHIKVPNKMTYNRLLSNSAIMTSSVVYNASELGVVKMKEVYYDDFACWLELLRRGISCKGLNNASLRYRYTGAESVSGNKFKSAKKVWWQLRNVEYLSLVKAVYCFAGYSIRGYLKHRKL